MAPTTRPRTLALTVSLTSTAPTAHSPPNPSPCRLRVSSSCQNEFVKADSSVNNENHRMVICSTRTRPMRSASMPGEPAPGGGHDEHCRSEVACFRFREMPEANQRRDDERVHLGIERVDRPPAETSPESPFLGARKRGEPSEHHWTGSQPTRRSRFAEAKRDFRLRGLRGADGWSRKQTRSSHPLQARISVRQHDLECGDPAPLFRSGASGVFSAPLRDCLCGDPSQNSRPLRSRRGGAEGKAAIRDLKSKFERIKKQGPELAPSLRSQPKA